MALKASIKSTILNDEEESSWDVDEALREIMEGSMNSRSKNPLQHKGELKSLPGNLLFDSHSTSSMLVSTQKLVGPTGNSEIMMAKGSDNEKQNHETSSCEEKAEGVQSHRKASTENLYKPAQSKAGVKKPNDPKICKRKSYVLHDEARVLQIVATAEALDNNLAIQKYYNIHEANIRRWRKQYKDAAKPSPDQDAIEKIARSKSQRTRMFQDIERLLYEWVRSRREEFLPLSQLMIREKALEIYHTLPQYKGITFRGSPGWFYGFAKAYNLTKRKATHVMQRLPGELSRKISDFSKKYGIREEKTLIRFIEWSI